MMRTSDAVLDKRTIAGRFGRAAGSYDHHADLQRRTVVSLAERERLVSGSGRILDLGSGTGFGGEHLDGLYPEGDIVSLDIALPMLRYAAAKYRHGTRHPVCGDAESLPFRDNSFDAVFSSLTIQWCMHYPRLFREIRRVLRSGGKALLSTFGPGTLRELREAWLAVDDRRHVNEFQPASAVVSAIQPRQFAEVSVETETLVRYYPDVAALGKELKAIGANSIPRGEGRGLTGKRRLQCLREAFQAGEVPGLGVPVSYQLIYLSLTR